MIGSRWAKWAELLAWAVPLGVFVVCRTFSGVPISTVGSDALGYLKLAEGFPSYRLYAGCLYLMHPPVFVWAIALVGLLLPIVVAGLVVTQAAAVGVFFLVKKYLEVQGVGAVGKMVGLLYLGMLTLSIAWDRQITRYSMMVGVMGLVIVGVEGYLRTQKPTDSYPWALWKWRGAAIGGSLLAFLTTDQAMILFPCVVVVFVCSRRWEKWRGVLFLLICMAGVAVIWPAVRWSVFATHRDYPAGIDGMVEPVGEYKWIAAVQPNLLPNTAANNAKFMGGVTTLWPRRWDRIWEEPLRLTVRWPIAARWVVSVLAVFGLVRPRSWGVTRQRVWYYVDEPWVSAKLLLLFLLLYWPAIAGLYPWYGMGMVLPMGVMVGRGAEGVWGLMKTVARFDFAHHRLKCHCRLGERWIVAGAGVLSVIFCVDWVMAKPTGPIVLPDFPPAGGNFLYSEQTTYTAEGLGKKLNRFAPGAAWMSPVGVTNSLAFEGSSALALPFDPAVLAEETAEYHVGYLVLPESLLQIHFGGAVTRRYTCQEIARFVDSQREKYPLVALMNLNGEVYRIYEVGGR